MNLNNISAINNQLPFQNGNISDESVDHETLRLRELYRGRIQESRDGAGAAIRATGKLQKGRLDCEGLAHYIMTGMIGTFEGDQDSSALVNRVKLTNAHLPYSCYKFWQPNAPWMREKEGYWGPVHYFTHLENGRYISTNGCGPIRIFSSYEEMLRKDGFPSGLFTEDDQITKDIEQAMIGESFLGTIHL